MNFVDHLFQHVNQIDKTKAKPNPDSNLNVYKSNSENTICLIWNNLILANNLHAYQYCYKKTGYLYRFKHKECHERKLEITILFHNGVKLGFRLIIEYLANKYSHSNINCIAHSAMETFLTFFNY